MDNGNRRFENLRSTTVSLLGKGEQPHIEFKREVIIDKVAKQVASGANYVAFQPSAKVHTIVYGVVEEDLAGNGATVGSIVGLNSAGGAPTDLDALRLRIEQTIRSNVRPAPNVSIYLENVSDMPILVVEVRPTAAPHLVGDGWHIRGVGGVRAMTPDEALAIFKNQRLSAWIDEFENSDPLKASLLAMHASIDEVRFALAGLEVSSATIDPEPPDMEFTERALRDVDERLTSIDNNLSDAVDSIEEVRKDAADAASNTGEATAESAWWGVMKARQMRMNTIYLFGSALGSAKLAMVNGLFRDYLGETADYNAFAENLAEYAAYRTLRRAGTAPSRELSAASDLVVAAVWRCNGMPPFFGFNWLEDVQSTKGLIARTAFEMRDRAQGLELEIGVLDLPGLSAERMLAELGATPSLNQRVLSVATPSGVYRIAVPNNGSIWPLVFAPGTEVDADAGVDISTVVARISALIADCGGATWCIEGAGVAIPMAELAG